MHAKVPVVDLGPRPSPPPPPYLFLDQTKARRAEKIILETAASPLPPPHQSKGLDDRTPVLPRGLDPALVPSVRYRVSCQTEPFLVFFLTRQERRRIKLGTILKKKIITKGRYIKKRKIHACTDLAFSCHDSVHTRIQ